MFSTLDDHHSGGCKGSGSGSSATGTNEPGLAGVRVTIASAATPNTILQSRVTNATGNYKFLTLLPGTYVVCVIFAGQARTDANFGYHTTAVTGNTKPGDK